jgi:opacity protein-like surface antigen
MKKLAVGLFLASMVMAPASAADIVFADVELFENNGQCQSAIIDVRNGVRKLSNINVNGSTVRLVCRLITSGPNQGKYQIIVG